MSEVGKPWQGQVVNGEFPLLRYLGRSDHSTGFLTQRKEEPRSAAIKLIPATAVDAGTQLSRWEAAAKLSHPQLIRLFEMGRCQLENNAYLYVVMEYADENLSLVLPSRSLTAAETREMLLPILQALRYLHGKGFVHGHIKPANIMAIGDQIRISSDGVVRADQASGAGFTPGLYDPPEARSTGLSPTGDVWSLGMTLVEALTQRPPVREATPGGELLLPQSLPAPFSDIARHCLRRSPEERWSLDQLAWRLEQPASSKPPTIQTVGPSQSKFGNRGWVMAAVVVGLILLAVAAISRPWHRVPEVQPSPSSSARGPSPTPESTQPSAASAIVQQVLPDVSRGSRNTIRGTIRVKIRVAVDSSGDVSNANFVSPGPSKYFANLALQSAHKWKFAPATANGDAGNEWILTFEFRQSGTRATANPAEHKP
jgi:TonB family protein